MTRFIIKRILLTIPILFGVSIICFLLMSVLPGNPAATFLSDQMSAQQKQEIMDQMGLNDPLPVRYAKWLGQVLQGNLGYSAQRQRDVSQLIEQAYSYTFILAIVSAVFGVTVGLILGYIAGTRRGKVTDRTVSFFSLCGLSIPSFFVAIILLSIFAGQLKLLPAGGATLDQGLGPAIQCLIMPVLAGAIVTMAITARVTRASIIDVGSSDFVETLRAKGLKEREVRRHVVRNAMGPVLTTSGVQLGLLLGGSVLVETIFRWPGMGLLVFNAISSRDLLVVQAATLIIAVTFVLINLIVDILQAVIDPRVRGALV